MEKRSVIAIISITFLLIALPYLAGAIKGNDEMIFTGLILNPVDGYSYYAKMAQGYNGSWLFQLPFTADPGKPVFLFFFYILLGHISRVLNVSIPLIYHIARLSGFVFMAWQLWRFIGKNLNLDKISKNWCYLYVLFASGMGWLGLLFGYETGDFIIPEAYPFYSSLINPHFAWGIGLFIYILHKILDDERKDYLLLIIASVVLAIIMPFGSVILCVVISIFWLLQNMDGKRKFLGKILVVCIPAALIVGFQYYETLTHPMLKIWNQQNITPTPPIWDILLSFSPMILIAFISIRKWKKFGLDQFRQMILLWFLICLLMIFIPFGFQRRFMFAFAIPVTVLGLMGLNDLMIIVKSPEIWKKILFVLPAISIIFLLLISFFAIIGGTSYSFITKDEANLYEWLSSNLSEEVILAEPEIAVKIPALAGNSVYYGHPYETIDADTKKQNIDTWYACNNGNLNIFRLLVGEGIDLVVVDKGSENGLCFSMLPILFENDEFFLYEVNK